VNAIALLMGLLLLSYLGSLLVGRGNSGGLASGIEFVGLGFAVGPHALGLVSRPMIVEFEPIIQVALGWLAFLIGLDFGRVEGRRVNKANAALGIACAVLTGVVVAGAAWRMLLASPLGLDPTSRLALVAGAGAVSAETARNAVEWVGARWGARGPLSTLLVDIGAADDLAPLVAAGAIFALAPSEGLPIALPVWGWFGASLATGVLLGFVTAMLLRGGGKGLEREAVWGALIGSILLVVGTAARFGLSTIFVTFVMGITLAVASPSRPALRRRVRPTERAALYPLLLLAGARLDLRPLYDDHRLAALVALVLMARIVGKIVSGVVIREVSEPAKPAGHLFGIVLLSSGPVSTSVGLVFALRFPGPVGDTLLVCAVASALLGELVSTFALKALLTEAGEIAPPQAATTPQAVVGASAPPPALVPGRSASTIPPPMPESRYQLPHDED